MRFNNFVRHNLGLILVILIAIVPLISLVPEGFPNTHDGRDHMARIANFYDSLSEGNLIPRWAENLNWGYGHPIMMFLYPLPSYLSSLFHFIGFSITDSVKLVFALSYIASGVAMYFWAKNQFNEHVGIASAVLYMYAPYRFVDLYVRGAIGEHVAFTFLPLTLYLIFKFHKSSKNLHRFIYLALVSISIALLILSHNAISIMFLPVVVFYMIVLSVLRTTWRSLLVLTSTIIVGFLLSSFFIVPAFLEGKYTLREIVTGKEYMERFVDIGKLFKSEWSYKGTGEFSTEIGILHLVGLVLSPILLYKFFRKKRVYFLIFLGALFFFLLSIFLMLPVGNVVYDIFTVLKKFQFPWRFLSLTVFASSVMTAMILVLIRGRNLRNAILIFGVIFLVFSSFEKFQANGYLIKEDNFYESIYYGTTDTGESAPIWSVRFMEKEPNARIETIVGDTKISEVYRSSVKHSYSIEVLSDAARLRENTLYFPGWSVEVDGVKKDIEFQDPSHRGLITFELPKGQHAVEVKFSNTKLRSLAELVSLVTMLSILFGLGILYSHEKKKHTR